MVEEADAEGAGRVAALGRASERLAAIRSSFADEAAFRSALASLGMTERQMLGRLATQEYALLLIDQQLRPLATVEPAEIENYYRTTFAPQFVRLNRRSPPPLAEVEAQIREILVQKKIDQLLPAWLEKLKASHTVRIHNRGG